jgi:thiopeptide-type bacteriocin biosynthesis protein
LDQLARPGPQPEVTKIRRAATALMRYLLRAQARPTPFGLFAGVAPLALAAPTTVSWSGPHQEIAQPSSAWLAAYIAGVAVEASKTVVAAQTIRVEGDRAVLAHAPHSDDPRKAAAVSVRHSPTVDLVLNHARRPIALAKLRLLLTDAFPGTTLGAADALLNELVRHRILIGSALPPVWHPRPLSRLAEHTPGLQSAIRTLERHNHPAATGVERERLRAELHEHLSTQSSVVRPSVAVDTRLSVTASVHPRVALEAARAAGIAANLSPHPTGLPAWADYHQRCLETYGQGAVVDLLTLTAPAGLGFPASFVTSRLPQPGSGTDAGRVKSLVAAASAAAVRGLPELDLDSAEWKHLIARTPARVPTHIEVRAHLLAASCAAVDAGDYRLWITGLSKGVGTLIGRFAHLEGMPDACVDRHLPTLTEGALPVQILAPPMADGAAHVARSVVVASRVLVIDGHPPDPLTDVQVIDPREVAVHIDADHLRLLHTLTGAVLEPFLASALDTRHYTHPLARFLAELPRARTALYPNHDPWPEATADCVFLPRLRTGRTILTPARWRLARTDWPTARIRSHLCLPRNVVLVQGERGLSLDLDQQAHRSLLESHLRRHGSATLTEAPEAEGLAWCGGHAHELVLPVGSTAIPAPAPISSAAPVRPAPSAFKSRGWSSYHLYTDPSVFGAVLAHLPELRARLDGPTRAWFVRYSDHDGPHIRLRLHNHGGPGALNAVMATWCHDLSKAGLLHTVATHLYRPEYHRYGHGRTMEIAETVFVHDSDCVLAQLAITGPPSQVDALAALSLLRIAEAMGADPGWLTTYLSRSAEPVDRDALTRAHRLLAHPTELPSTLASTWKSRDEALIGYRHQHGQPLRVLPSLLHMHHNRLHGPDRGDERRVFALARSLVLTRLHHRERAHVRP